MMFSSRPPFNDDPFPYVGPTGSRHRYPGTLDGVRLTHDPHPHFDRPQNNPANPILLDYREDDKDADYWLRVVESPRYIYTLGGYHEAVAHARRVLTRLANLSKGDA